MSTWAHVHEALRALSAIKQMVASSGSLQPEPATALLRAAVPASDPTVERLLKCESRVRDRTRKLADALTERMSKASHGVCQQPYVVDMGIATAPGGGATWDHVLHALQALVDYRHAVDYFRTLFEVAPPAPHGFAADACAQRPLLPTPLTAASGAAPPGSVEPPAWRAHRLATQAAALKVTNLRPDALDGPCLDPDLASAVPLGALLDSSAPTGHAAVALIVRYASTWVERASRMAFHVVRVDDGEPGPGGAS